jgi:superfamily I DNA/RNA helicase
VGIEARGRTSLLKLNYRNTAEVTALALHCAQPLFDASLQGGSGSTRPGELTTLAKTGSGDNGNSSDSSLDDKPHLVWPASAGRHGPLPVLVQARHGVDEARLVGERIVAALASGVPTDQIGVLCRARYLLRPIEQELARLGVACQSMNAQGVRHADGKPDAVRLLTLHNAKGLEFSLCCVVGLQALPMPGEALDDALRLVYVGMTRARHELLLSAHGSSPLVERVRLGMAALQQQFDTPAEAGAALVSPF